MKTATMLRIVQEWPAHRVRVKTRDRIALHYARRLLAGLNRDCLRDGVAAWLRIDRRRGWLVVTYYGGEEN
jgi:hypothetical protein